MFHFDPHVRLRNCRINRRENLVCAAFISAAVLIISGLLWVIVSQPFSPRVPAPPKAMNIFSLAVLTVFGLVCLGRIAIDLWQAFLTTREMQFYDWAALSLNQEVGS